MCLAASECTPLCTQKYSSTYPDIHWVSTGHSLYLMSLDRQVTDLNWKMAHGVTYTANRLISFGYHFDPMCFCAEHLFFSCSLAQQGIAWVRPLYHLASPRLLLLIVDLCYLSSRATSYFVSITLLMTSSILSGDRETTSV